MIPKRLKIHAGSHPENLPHPSFSPGLTVREEHLTWVVLTVANKILQFVSKSFGWNNDEILILPAEVQFYSRCRSDDI